MFGPRVVHLRGENFKSFRAAWNLLCGIPFLIPSFLYQTHSLHHVRKHYGTKGDGEYLPLATGPALKTFCCICASRLWCLLSPRSVSWYWHR